MIRFWVIKHVVCQQIPMSNEIKKRVDTIKSLLECMNDGEISISAYDTAWVALVEEEENVGNTGSSIRRPQFPESLRWIADNQLLDGSWGDPEIFSAHDRIISTLACVVALKSWGLHPDKCKMGTFDFGKHAYVVYCYVLISAN